MSISSAKIVGKVGFHTTQVVAFLGLLFLIAPIVFLIPLSFSTSARLEYPISGLTLKWYETIFKPYPWLFSFKNSLLVACATTVLSTVLGTAAAYGLDTATFRFKSTIVAFLLAPLVIPSVIVALAIYFLLARFQMIGTFPGLVVGHTVVCVPFVVLMVSVSLHNFDRDLVRSALSLGAKPWKVFFTVTLPLIAPGVAAGAILAFVNSFDEVIVAIFIAGPNQLTLPRQLLNSLEFSIDPSIIAISTIVIVISAVLLSVVEFLRNRQ